LQRMPTWWRDIALAVEEAEIEAQNARLKHGD